MSVQRVWEILKKLEVRAVITVIVLSSFCATIFPISTPLLNLINHSEGNTAPYPCQSSACGCNTPERCWRNCCCNTHQEKMEWAKKNDVTPPAYFFKLLAEELATATLGQEEPVCQQPFEAEKKLNKSCCSDGDCQETTVAVCIVDTSNMCGTYTKPAVKKKECCSKITASKEAPQDTPNTHTKDSKSLKKDKPQYLIGALVLKCQGRSSAINFLPWMNVPEPQIFTILETTCFYCRPTSFAFESRTIEPPHPPPRSRFA